ncbi:hypothetical protein SCALM49S_02078 [Streptomyces californicus]
MATEWKAGCSATAASSLRSALHRARLRLHQDARHQVGEDPDAVARAAISRPASETRPESCSAVKRRGTGSPSPNRPAGSVSAWRASVKRPAKRAGQDGSAETGGQQAERARGAQRLDRVAHALGGLVDVLQDAVAAHGVETAAVDDVEQAEDVALDAPDPVGHPGLGRAALQCEERVGARVDDGDAVAEPGGGRRRSRPCRPGVQVRQGVRADRLA